MDSMKECDKLLHQCLVLLPQPGLLSCEILLDMNSPAGIQDALAEFHEQVEFDVQLGLANSVHRIKFTLEFNVERRFREGLHPFSGELGLLSISTHPPIFFENFF